LSGSEPSGVVPRITVIRRPFLVASAFLLLFAGTAAARAKAPVCGTGCKAAPAGSGALFVLSGHGWGHGVGMGQYGAYGYAQHGWAYDQILAHYYPGTTLGPAPASRVRVLLANGARRLTIASTAPFRAKDATGASVQLPAGSYTFGPALKLKVGAAPARALTPPVTFRPGGAPLELRRPYRGSLELDVVDGKLRAIDAVGLEQYLDGVVPAEMPSNWAPEALKAQAVVARSYALATRRVAAPFDLYPDTRSQVYLGVSAEMPSTNEAVADTAGQVVLYDGKVATTYFYSTSGGRTANSTDVWAGLPVPYLVSVADPYDAISPYHDWGPFPFTGATLAKAFHVPGKVTDAETTVTSSGRVASLELVGTLGDVDVRGTSVRTALKLRSTWFAVGVLSLTRPAPVKPVEYGSQAQLSALVRGIPGVTLEERPSGSAWQSLSAVRSGSATPVAVAARPIVTTDYRLATSAVAAAPVRVAVMPRVRLATPSTAGEVTGTVRPVLAGAAVQIQRQDAAGGPWTTVATAALDSGGSFDVSLALAPGTYRARVPATRGYATGTSPTLSVGAG
jgi:stage II sporulation protein D